VLREIDAAAAASGRTRNTEIIFALVTYFRALGEKHSKSRQPAVAGG